MTRRITLIRHGESLANLAQRWQGQGNSELSELGRAQARALGTRLAGRAFTRVIASDLERAQATARALERPYECDASFREFDIGAWEGLTREEVVQRFPEQLARLEAGEDIAIGGGESYRAFCARVDAALARVRDQLDPEDHAVIVCHGGVIGALISAALDLRGVRELPISRVLNTSISELAFRDDGESHVRVFNDSIHLAALGPLSNPELREAIALSAEQPPHPSFGDFGAHYDYEIGLDPALCTWLADEVPTLLQVARAVRARHPEQRIALSASAPRVHGWAHELLGTRLDHGRLSPPITGALCHVIAGERPALLDYGVSV